jgi:polyadenylate-binding protein 2
MDELQMDEALENGKGLNESGSSSDVYGSHLDHQEDSENMVSENNEGEDESKDAAGNPEDSELEAIKARVREMEEEAEKLRQLQTEVDRHMNIGSPPGGGTTTMSIEEKMEVDGRSVYVGNVDYGATAEELEQHFHGCGSINRVTILCNKFDGHPKGFAYIEFADRESVNTAMAMDESLFRGRQIKVMPKRTNRPGLSRTDRPPRGGSIRGSSFSRATFRGRGSYPFRGHPRFPRRYRARGSYFSPY